MVVIDEFGTVIHDVYLRTAGRPIEAVQQGLAEVERIWGSRLKVCGVGTTGSGRELIAEFVGADVVNDEITAHKTGAIHISSTLGGEPVDTIFEIGGQDSKFISIENGVVVDFAMNEACAAGTGSFLEEQAEKLGISIKGEFARLALSAQSPTRLGERCTVFMERDVTGWMHKGETVPHLVAGLAYSIALNYLNRVVRGRKIGKVIYFQGGTAYNDAVTAAFASLLGKKITVPPYNGVMGAIGMALIARQWHAATQGESRFRGYDLHKLELTTRDFVCKACSNLCDMKEFVIEGQKSFWGDKCSDKFRKPSSTGRKPVIDDLFAYREELLEALPTVAGGKFKIGLPRAMSMLDRLPFWKRYFAELGLETVLSPVTDPRISAGGIELSVAEPCYPVQVAHGHVQALTTAGVDYVWLPVMADAEAGDDGCASHYCPWNQTLPWVLKSAPGLEAHAQKFLTPTLHFRLGPEQIKKALAETMRRVGVTQARQRPRGGCGLYGAAQIPGTPDRGRAQGAGGAGEQRGAGDRAGGARIQHVRSRGELRHPAQTAPPLRRQRDPAGFPGDGKRAALRTARQHVLDLGPQDSGGRAHRFGKAQPAHDLPDQFQVRAGQLHQALRAGGRRRAAADSAI